MRLSGTDTDSLREEGERPFWISYADLMTALMILFLVVMVVALSAIVKKTEDILEKSSEVDERVELEDQRVAATEDVCEYLAQRSKESGRSELNVDCRLNRINFGEAGRYDTDQYRPSEFTSEMLADLVPLILDTAETPMGKRWLKQVIIEGLTDTDGSYLYNLNLSLRRSEYLMCLLLGGVPEFNVALTPFQRVQVKRLFLAGGVAFNDMKGTKDESRRVELKLVFYGVDERPEDAASYMGKFQDDPADRCRI